MGKVRQTALLKALARNPGEWKEKEVTDDMRRDFPHLLYCERVWFNNKHECQAFKVLSPIGGVWQLNVVRHGNLESTDWQEKQKIVHDLFGPEVYAVEIYPPIEHEWRTNLKISVLWVLPSTWALPFGLHVAGAWGKPNGN